MCSIEDASLLPPRNENIHGRRGRVWRCLIIPSYVCFCLQCACASLKRPLGSAKERSVNIRWIIRQGPKRTPDAQRLLRAAHLPAPCGSQGRRGTPQTFHRGGGRSPNAPQGEAHKSSIGRTRLHRRRWVGQTKTFHRAVVLLS